MMGQNHGERPLAELTQSAHEPGVGRLCRAVESAAYVRRTRRLWVVPPFNPT
jgi:hypothetical protein